MWGSMLKEPTNDRMSDPVRRVYVRLSRYVRFDAWDAAGLAVSYLLTTASQPNSHCAHTVTISSP